MLQGMEGSTLGVWIACGEGRALFPDPQVLEQVKVSSRRRRHRRHRRRRVMGVHMHARRGPLSRLAGR